MKTKTIWEIVSDALSTLDVPVAENQMIAPSGEQLPDQYVVYQLVVDSPALHADDGEVLSEPLVQVAIYSRSGLSNLPDVAGAMTAAGFTRGERREQPYNPTTRHFGLVLEFYLLTEE